MARLFGYPGYARFWTASTVSMFGSYVSSVAVPVLAIVTLQASNAEVGVLTGARYAPYLLFGLLAGVMADRYRRRPILISTDLARFVLLGLLVILALTGWLTVPMMIGFVAIFGLLSLLSEAADQSFLPRLVPSEALMQANGRLQQSGSIAQTTGPLLAGALIKAVGIPFALLVDAFSYLFSAFLLMSVRVIEPVPHPASRNLRAELREGLRWVYRHPVLAPYALTLHSRFLFAAMASTVFTLFVTRGLQPGLSEDDAAWRLGLVLAVGGVGAVAGNALAGVMTKWGVGRIIVAERLFEPFGWMFAALAVLGSWGWVMVAASQFLVWGGIGISGPHEMGYRQAVTPDHLQGRMNATIRSLNWGMLTIGAPIGGLLVDWIGYRPGLWLAITGMLAVATVAASSSIRTARHPVTEPKPEPVAAQHGVV